MKAEELIDRYCAKDYKNKKWNQLQVDWLTDRYSQKIIKQQLE
jgi:hypothetical protein